MEQVIHKFTTDVSETLAPETQHIVGQTLQLLVNGCLVPPYEVSIRLQVQTHKVISILRGLGAEFDKDGNMLGIGLTLVPTQHIYKVDDRKLYTWCAIDALLFPVMLKHTAHIESYDPITGEKIRVTVTPEKVEKVEPKTAAVSWVKSVDVVNSRGSVCQYVHFFISPEIATKWIVDHGDKMFYTANEVYQASKDIFLNKYHDMTAAAQQTKMRC
jgi:alkylmercury lyase